MTTSISTRSASRSDFRRPGARSSANREALLARATRRRGEGPGVESEQRRRLLAENRLFAQLSDAELDRVLTFAGTRRVRRNQEVFHRGDLGDQLFVLVSGRAKVTSSSSDGKGIVFGFLDAGDVFGEIAFFDGRARTASVVAIRPTELLVIHRRDFVPFLERNPGVALKLLTGMAERLRATDQVLEDRVFLNLPPRLAKKLLHLAQSYGHPERDGLRIQMKISQSELGEMVGTTRESVNKQLRSWEEAGLVLLDHGYITLREPGALHSIAGFVLA